MWVLSILWWWFGYAVARLIFPLVSFGKVWVAPLDRDEGFGWLCCRRNGDGQVEVESLVAGWIGLLIGCICLALCLHFF